MDRIWNRLRLGVMITDAVLICAAYTTVTYARFGLNALLPEPGMFPAYPALILGVTALMLIAAWQIGVYRRWALLGGHRVYPMLLTVTTYGVVAVIILDYVVQASPLIEREWLAGSWASCVMVLIASHLFWRQVALGLRRRGILIRRVLVAGANQQGIAVAQQLNAEALHGTKVVGFLDDYQRPGTEISEGLKVVGHPGSVLDRARELRADEVIIIAGALAWESQRMLAEMVTRSDSAIEAKISPTYYDLLTTSAELSEIAYVPMLTLHRTRLSGANAAMKGLVDRGAAALMLVALTPAWLVWVLRAQLGRRPLLRRQRVLGLGGQQFDVYALDPHLTNSPILARCPALWNVWRRQLSLVGPRPIHASEVSSHERWIANLVAMRPGLTGFWRLRPGNPPLEERVALDLFYVRNYTLNLDLQILFNTVKQLLLRSIRRPASLARWGGPPPAPPEGPTAPDEAVQPEDVADAHGRAGREAAYHQ